MKATSFIIGIILASLIVGSFSLFIVDLSDSYSVTYDNSTLPLYNKLNATQTQAFALHTKVNSTETNTGIFDVIGDWVTKAVDSLKLTFISMNAASEMVEYGTEDLGFPKIYSTAIITIIIIFIVLGVIISAMVKRDL